MPRSPIVGMTCDIRFGDGTVWPAVVTAVNTATNVNVRVNANNETFANCEWISGSTFYNGGALP